MKFALTFLFIIAGLQFSYSQCQNNFQWPANTLSAPTNFDTVLISIGSFAGDFAEANGFVGGETYRFTSDSLNDLITLRSIDQNTVLAFGTQPLDYTITTDTAISIHINTPGCGTQNIQRVTRMIHVEVVEPNNVGINTEAPMAGLDINGTLKVSSDENTPTAGMIRYNEDTEDFEGFDGTKWKSFTKASAPWGDLRTPIATSSNCLIAEDGGSIDFFGVRLDINDDFVVIAAPAQDNEGYFSNGAVYIYKRQDGEFIFLQKLLSSSGEDFSQFGNGDVDIYGDYLIVGSPNQPHQQSIGTAEIFEFNNGTWTWKTTLGNNHPDNNFHFGHDVAINDQYAAVRNQDLINGIDEVLLFKKSGMSWDLIETIIAPTNSGTFGASLEFHNEELFVGDPDYIGAGVIGGRVSIYSIDENDNVAVVDHINNPGENTNFGDQFGFDLDLSGDRMIVSSFGYQVNGLFRSGRAYIFMKENGNWELEKTLQENPPKEGSDFGLKVSIYNDQALVSTSGFSSTRESYVYKLDNDWKLESILMSGEQSETDFFGIGAEIDENLIVIGASRTTIGENLHQGKVYLFCK